MARFSVLGWDHLVLFGVVVPYLVIRSRRKVTGPAAAPLDRMKHLQSTSVMLLFFGAISVLTAHREAIDLFSAHARDVAIALPAGLAMFVAAVFFMRPRWRRAVETRKRIVYFHMPSNATERAWWVTVAILAGISEEITWRGVQMTLLSDLLGSALIAAVVCAVMFGLAHVVQGWRSAIIIGVFALGFQGLVWLSGSLYVAMAVHAAYDITAGLTYGRLGKELGYRLDEGREISSSPSHAPGPPL